MGFQTSVWFRKRLEKWKRNHFFFNTSWVAKQWEKIYFWYLLQRPTVFPSPRPNRGSLETVEKQHLVGTYAVGSMAYQAHKAKLGQARYGNMMWHWNHEYGLSQGMVSCVTKFAYIQQHLHLLVRTHPFLYKSSWESRTVRVQWPWSHQWHQLQERELSLLHFSVAFIRWFMAWKMQNFSWTSIVISFSKYTYRFTAEIWIAWLPVGTQLTSVMEVLEIWKDTTLHLHKTAVRIRFFLS